MRIATSAAKPRDNLIQASRSAYVGLLLVLVAVYVASGKAGLALAFVNPSTTAIWPPTGLAIAANLLFGYSVWPAVFVGALVTNVLTAGSAATSLAIAAGNTLEAFLAAFLVRRFSQGRLSFETPAGVFKFGILAAALAPVVSATIGVTTLTLSGNASWQDFAHIWLTWWLGDAGGALIVTPLLVVWATHPLDALRPRLIEAGALLVALAVVSQLVFGGVAVLSRSNYPVDFLFIPILVWAAFRLGMHATSAATFLLSSLAVLGTWRGFGPFADTPPNEALLLVQLFMSVLSITALALATAVQGHERAREVLQRHAREAALRADVSAALSSQASLSEIIQTCTEALVQHLDAAYARVWLFKDEDNLELLGSAGSARLSGPLQQVTLPRGAFKIGRVAAEREVLVSDDLMHDPEFSDTDWAKREGMSSYVGYPLVVEARGLGAVALFARHPFSPDTIEDMAPVAAAMAQGIERKRAAEQRDRLLAAEQDARVRAESAERRLQAIIDSMPQGIVVVDPLGRAMFRNAAAEAIAGPAEQGSDVHAYMETGMWHMDGKPWRAHETPMGRAISQGETIHGEQMLVLNRATGGRVPILAAAAPIYDGSGALLGCVAVFQDISALKELEQQKVEFLNAAAHDLNTPLTIVKGLAQLLERQMAAGREPARVTETLGRITSATDKMAQLVDELLDVSRMDMQKPMDLVREDTDLVQLARRIVDEYLQGQATHDLKIEAQAESIVGCWDARRLERALGNLISNAIKYSPRGGPIRVKLAIEEHDRRRWAAVAVTDSGVGIPAADLPRIFDRFQRATNVRGRIAGTGIGLAYVSEVLSQHDGNVSARSTEGKGSTFTVRLPLD